MSRKSYQYEDEEIKDIYIKRMDSYPVFNVCGGHDTCQLMPQQEGYQEPAGG